MSKSFLGMGNTISREARDATLVCEKPSLVSTAGGDEVTDVVLVVPVTLVLLSWVLPTRDDCTSPAEGDEVIDVVFVMVPVKLVLLTCVLPRDDCTFPSGALCGSFNVALWV
jgi:hypothetical protein